MPSESPARMGSFGNVDATSQAEQFIAFLDRVERAPMAIGIRRRSYELLQGMPGQRAVDVGCGIGRAVSEMNEHGMRATGVDNSEEMIKFARQRFPEADFRVASADALPLDDGSMDRYRAERLFQHLGDPIAALKEARRVLRTDGRIVLVDQDWDTVAIESDNMELTRRITRAFSDSITNRWAGRKLRGLLVDAGFQDVAVEAQVAIYTDSGPVSGAFQSIAKAAVDAGAVKQSEADAWFADQSRRGREGSFLFAVPLFMACGRKG